MLVYLLWCVSWRRDEIWFVTVFVPHLDNGFEVYFSKSKWGSKALGISSFFKKFILRPSTESYIDGLCKPLKSIAIGSPVTCPGPKCRLSKTLFDKQTSNEEKSCILYKIQRRFYNNSEEDDFETPELPVAEVPGESLSSKKRIRRRIEDDQIPF